MPGLPLGGHGLVLQAQLSPKLLGVPAFVGGGEHRLQGDPGQPGAVHRGQDLIQTALGQAAEHQHGLQEGLLHWAGLLTAGQQLFQRQAILLRRDLPDPHPKHKKDLAEFGPLRAGAVVHKNGLTCHWDPSC